MASPDSPSRRERIVGSMLGGAVGDALGAPVEFVSLEEIRRRHGAEGVTGYPAGPARFTDDTQMALFTAEGLIRARERYAADGINAVPPVVHEAYLRWLHTQGEFSSHPAFRPDDFDGLLVGQETLFRREAPGNTCLGSLRADSLLTRWHPVNDSKGCGGVMRMAPVGLTGSPSAFALGCDLGALTHGHPSGFLAAGFLASLLACVVHGGEDLHSSFSRAQAQLADELDSEECARATRVAWDLWEEGGDPSAERVESLGEGWVAEEALAIGLYCALVGDSANSFRRGVLLAVNHGGDSDSTGAIAGNILGAALGRGAIPAAWIEELEGANLVERVALDLEAAYSPGADQDDKERLRDDYPAASR